MTTPQDYRTLADKVEVGGVDACIAVCLEARMNDE